MVARQIQILSAALLYYGLVLPLSLLPLRFLYVFADAFYLLLISIVPYRKKVVSDNIDRAFAQLSKEEKSKIRKDFYRFFSDLLVESIKNLSISKEELSRRFRLQNPEILQALQTQNKPIILISSHYNNWEWLITSQALWFKQYNFGIGMPLSHPFWDKKLTARRERFGLIVVHAQNYHEAFQNNNSIVLVLADQAPSSAKQCLWLPFLNQESAVIFGPEYMANKYDCTVVYANIKNYKRGYYDVELEVLVENSRLLKYEELTRLHVQKLEAAIEQNPSRWLWSHRRWKHQKPDNLDEIKSVLRQKFEQTFRTHV